MGFIAHCCGCTPGGGVTLPGCPCTNIPQTLTVDVVSQAFNTHFIDGTMTWRTVPSDVASAFPESPAFWSDILDYDYTNTGIRYRWGLRCETGFYRLRAMAVEDPNPVFGLPYALSGTTYVIGASGNACSPFALTNGSNTIGLDVDVFP